VVAAGLFFALALLWVRVIWLQVGLHKHFEERAEQFQEQRILVRPERGVLLDRHRRPLAHDLVTYSISAAPREMTDPRATARDLARELGLDPRRLDRQFQARPRFLWVARQVPPEDGQRVAAWKRRGVVVAAETRRDYPLGAAASEIVGRCNLDHEGVDGLELVLDEHLRGRPGWLTRFRDGRGRSIELQRGLRRAPENGQHAVLTLDADLQSIVEMHLRRAVDTLRAVRGFAIFLDPRTGEVLASANVPHLPPGKARNWNFTDSYEPGSTYKVVVAGAALEEGAARPDQRFEAAASGEAQVAPGAIFHDTHEQESFTFRDAVRWSSNIVMGRLAMKIGAERLYRYSTELGFGSMTGLDFPGEAGGRLRRPDHWSARSCPTIAIGHEISVTPLQLALAYAAIANGGVLMEPMLVREILTPDGEVVRRNEPRAVRRVFGERTTADLREMLVAVVDSGTAKAARVPGLKIAGKTGTAQKYDPNVHTYGKGMYLSSFAGFAPAGDPSIVGVVVIDEPRGRHYYGGEIAAPVFREILLDLRRLPSRGLGSGAATVAARPPAPAPVAVPDVHLMVPEAVERRLASAGLRASFHGSGARVLAQDPAPGAPAERGAAVQLWLSAPTDSTSSVLPDLAGLPLREALRRLSRLEVGTRIAGRGFVVRQDPPPGSALPLAGPCRLWCEPNAPARSERLVAGAVAP